MALSQTSTLLISFILFILLATPAHAFGAGNIASVSTVEGVNWRHGDIEDTLLTIMMARVAGGKKFDKMNVARVYFGNWLRDYSQAIDVGTVKYVSAEAIRILLWVLGFMTFGYGTKEFEVTTERLGCYRPEDHIDNPKDYADNLDAREYDTRLRGPVNERVELGIDQRRGLKNYIASEELGITTSAGHVRKLFNRCIQLGRSYGRTKNEAELYEALRLLGTGLHCLEDWSAHSNYTELALIEMGERNIFPYVGRQTQIRLPGSNNPVYPVVTGTFGGVDFLHSVMGEFDDKATQSEIAQLENTMQNGSRADSSLLKDLLNKIPSGLFSNDDPSSKADELQANSNTAAMQNMHVTPKRPEAITQQMMEIQRQIFPVMEWHDDVMRSISEAINKIPVLPELIEQLEDQINIFVFSLLAPFVLPVINQLKVELNTGSGEIIQSSQDKQLNVFYDDRSTDPTHSMLSKDHFSDVLNEPAGKIASAVVGWVVPQLMQCWDDQRVDPDRTINRIINGVFHHPALRNQGEDGAVDCRRLMFRAVEQWWSRADQNGLRRQLSREGVQQGLNHKPGQHDTGHGCGKPLGMTKHSNQGGDGSSGMLGDLLSAMGGGTAAAGIGAGYGRPNQGSSQIGRMAEEAVGGGALGGIVGAVAGGIGAGLLGEVFSGGQSDTKAYSQQYQAPGGVTQSYTEYGKGRDEYGQTKYGQAEYSQTKYESGGQRTEYKKYEQSGREQTGYGYEERTETRPTYGGGYEATQERRRQEPGGTYETETWREGRTSGGHSYEEKHEKYKKSKSDSEESDGYGGKMKKKKEKKEKKEKKKKQYGEKSDSDDDDDDYKKPKHRSGEYSSETGGYGRQETSGYGGGGYEAPRQEYGSRGGYEEPSRQEFGSRGQYQDPLLQEYAPRGGYEEPARQEYGSRGGYEEPARQEYGGGGGYGGRTREETYEEPSIPGAFEDESALAYGGDGGRGGYGGGEEGYGGGRRDDEYQEEYREEGRGW